MYTSFKHTVIRQITSFPDHKLVLPFFNSRYFLPLPRLTDYLCRITVSGLLKTDVSKFKVNDSLKMDTTVLDLLLPEEVSPFDIHVMHMAGISPKHIIQYTSPVFRRLNAFILVRTLSKWQQCQWYVH